MKDKKQIIDEELHECTGFGVVLWVTVFIIFSVVALLIF